MLTILKRQNIIIVTLPKIRLSLYNLKRGGKHGHNSIEVWR